MSDDPSRDNDLAAISRLIMEHFESLSWQPGTQADWDRFRQDFLPEAQLFPAARPAQAKSVDAFIVRMEGVAQSGLHRFEEHTRKVVVQHFGNIAVAMGLSWMLENGTGENRDVSAYLLVKSGGDWKIAAHAWHPLGSEDAIPGIFA